MKMYAIVHVTVFFDIKEIPALTNFRFYKIKINHSNVVLFVLSIH